MAEEYEKYAVMKNMFRRRSSTEFTGAGINQVVDATEMPKLLDQMGTHVDPSLIKKQIDQVDTTHSGRLTYDQYQKVCEQFVKDTSNTATAQSLKSFCDFGD